MGKEIKSKIKRLFNIQPSGVVLTSSWLASQGYSAELLKKYRENSWLQSIGTGATIRQGEKVDYLGGINALQQQLNLSIHPAGKTALSLLGKVHYLEMHTQEVYLFGSAKEKLPSWFKNYNWGVKLKYFTSSFLPRNIGFESIQINNYDIRIASATRALMECLYLAPDKQNLIECFEIMQGLNNLPPEKTQQLLEQCTSIKVKRLFLYLAEKANHSWVNYLKPGSVGLGKGDRSIVNDGVYISKYRITVPKELETDEYARI